MPGFTLQPKLALPGQEGWRWRNIAQGHQGPRAAGAGHPDFEIGCKRILISNDYYPALDADNVDLVTDPIAKVTGDAVVTADGVERPIDVLVVATGFHTTDLPIAEQIRGRGGPQPGRTWRDDRDGGATRAPPSTASPTSSSIVGPNTGLGHSSMVFIIESQVAYIRDAIRTDARATGYATVEPHRDAQDAWNDDLQRRMKRTVWNTGGCSSWYLDEHGRNTVLWPRTTFTFRRQLAALRRRRRTTSTARTDATTAGGLAHEDARRQGRRDHRRRLRHRPRARRRRSPGSGALLALSDVDEAGLAETVDLVKNAGAREVRADRARRGRPGRVRGVRRRRSPSTSAGSTWSSTTPASR